MTKVVVIPVNKLTQQTITRARGKDAYGKLLEHLSFISERPLDVIIDLTSARVVTGSFIDELVLRTNELTCSGDVRVIFRLASDDDYIKLQRVCSLREIACTYQMGVSKTLHCMKIKPAATHITRHYPESAFFTP